MNQTLLGPQPVPTAETERYWQAALEGRLEVQRCRACARHQFYPRGFCTACLSDQIEWVLASGRGRIYTYTVCRIAAHPVFESRVPYVIAMIDLNEGVRLLAGIVDSDIERIAIGAPVEVQFERISDLIALPQFHLADGAQTI